MNIFTGTYRGMMRSINVSQASAVVVHGPNNYVAAFHDKDGGFYVCFDDDNGNALVELHKKEARHGDE